MEVKEAKEKLKGGINKTAILVALILGIAVLGFGLIQYLDERATDQVETERLKLQSESQRREREAIQEEQESRKAIMASCSETAEKAAASLLETKAELDKSNTVYKEGAEKGLFLKPDFDTYYEQCLRRNGIE